VESGREGFVLGGGGCLEVTLGFGGGDVHIALDLLLGQVVAVGVRGQRGKRFFVLEARLKKFAQFGPVMRHVVAS